MSKKIFHSLNRSFSTFDPTTVSGLEVWYDATDAASLTYDGSNLVGQLNDKSGNSRHLTQSTSGNKPTYVTSGGANGKPYISFTSGKTLSLASLSVSQPYTVYLALKNNSIANSTEVIGFDDSGVNGISYYTDSAGANSYGDIFSQINGTNWMNSRANYGTNFRIFKFVCNGSSSLSRVQSELEYWADNAGSYSTGTLGITKLKVGNTASFYFHELLIYSGVVSSSDDDNINDYMAAKYATSNYDYIAWMGDSITAGFNSTFRNRDAYASLVCDEKGKHLYNYGVAGTKIDYGGNAFSDLIHYPLKANTGWVVMGYGYNDGATNATDSTWGPRYKALVQQLIDAGYSTSKMIMTSMVYTAESWEPTVNTKIQGICTDLGITYGDIYTYMQSNGGLSLIADGTHPNDTGHRKIADYLKTLIT